VKYIKHTNNNKTKNKGKAIQPTVTHEMFLRWKLSYNVYDSQINNGIIKTCYKKNWMQIEYYAFYLSSKCT